MRRIAAMVVVLAASLAGADAIPAAATPATIGS